MEYWFDTKRLGLGMLLLIFIIGAAVLWFGETKKLAHGSLVRPEASISTTESQIGADDTLEQIKDYFNEKFLVESYIHDPGSSDHPWGRNPFLTPAEIRFFENGEREVAGTKGAGGAGASGGISITGIILGSDEKRIALVDDGRLLRVGDRVGSELVARIDIDGVVLANKNATRRIELPQSTVRLESSTRTTE